MNRLLTGVVCAATFALTLSAQTNARVRVVHASPDAPAVDIYVDGARALEGLPFREYSEYLALPAKQYNIEVKVGGTTVLQAQPTLAAGKDYTVLAVGRVSGGDNGLSILLLEDDNTTPVDGQVKFRIVHGAPGAPAVDVYVTTPFESIGQKTPVLSSVPFKAASGYLSIPLQMYQGRVTVAGTKTVAIDTHRLPTWGGMIRTIVAIDSPGGGGPFGVIVLPDRN